MLRAIEREGARIATILLPGVQYLTGQVLDIAAITAAGARARAASSAGTSRTRSATSRCSCTTAARISPCGATYKYLNGGPGAVGGAFVHARHATRPMPAAVCRLVGSRQGDPVPDGAASSSRYPAPRAGSSAIRRSWRWRRSSRRCSISQPSGMPALRRKSVALTGYFARPRAARDSRGRVEIVTPRSAPGARRGAVAAPAGSDARPGACRVRRPASPRRSCPTGASPT